MLAISVKETKKLVKGVKYPVLEYRNSSTRGFRSSIKIKDLGWFRLDFFIPGDGTSSFPKIDWKDHNIIDDETSNYIKNPENLKKGDLLVCVREGSIYLQKGNFYKIEDIKQETINRWTKVQVKVLGYNRWLSHYSFRIASQREIREISLLKLFDEQVPSTSIDKSTRKIDLLPNEKKELLLGQIIIRSVLDPWRNSMDIIDWAIKKIEPSLKLKRDDFFPIMQKTLTELCQENEKDNH